MKVYFKRDADSDLGEGMGYIEITDGWPSRQVEVYGNIWRWGDDEHLSFLGDQPLHVLDLGEEHQITAEEFEHVWSEARRRSPDGGPPVEPFP